MSQPEGPWLVPLSGRTVSLYFVLMKSRIDPDSLKSRSAKTL